MLTSPGGFDFMRKFLRTGAFEADRNQIGDALQNRVGHSFTLQAQARNRLGAKSDGGDDTLTCRIGVRRTQIGGFMQLAVHAIEIDGTGSIDLSRTPFVQGGRLKLKRIGNFADQLSRERLTAVDKE